MKKIFRKRFSEKDFQKNPSLNISLYYCY